MGRARRIGAGAIGIIALALVLAQVFLPGIAASSITSRLRKYGRVRSVSVSAWPAVKLLWGSTDSVRIRLLDLRLTPHQSAKLVWEGRGASSIDMTAGRAREGPLQLSDVGLRKRGDVLTAQGVASEADVRAALPAGLAIKLLGSERGNVSVNVSGGLFGLAASVNAVAGPIAGTLVARPVGFLFEGLRLTLFADPHVYVEGVGATAITPPGGPPSYRLTMSARLR